MVASPLQQHRSGRLLIQRKSSHILAPGGTSVQPQAVSCPTERPFHDTERLRNSLVMGVVHVKRPASPMLPIDTDYKLVLMAE